MQMVAATRGSKPQRRRRPHQLRHRLARLLDDIRAELTEYIVTSRRCPKLREREREARGAGSSAHLRFLFYSLVSFSSWARLCSLNMMCRSFFASALAKSQSSVSDRFEAWPSST